MPQPNLSFTFAGVTFTPLDGALLCGDRRTRLTRKTADLLLVLLESDGKVVTKEEIFQRVWPDTFVTDGNLTFHVHLLRKALGQAAEGASLIETLPGRGYRWLAPVDIEPADATASVGSAALASPVTDSPRPDAAVDTITVVPRPIRSAGSSSRRFHWGLLAGGTAVVAALVAVAARGVWPRSERYVAHDAFYRQLGDSSRISFSDQPLIVRDDTIFFARDRYQRTGAFTMNGDVDTASFDGFRLHDYSPVSRQFLATRIGDPGAEQGIWTIDQNGERPRRLGELRGDEPVWSPDASTIAYIGERSLWIARADGATTKPILSDAGGGVNHPRFSPDGTVLRFTLSIYSDRETSSSLYEIGTDGKGLRPLLAEWNEEPRECCGFWTRDGRSFIFESLKTGIRQLWAIDETAAERAPRQLTNGTIELHHTALSADGRSVYAIGRDRTQGELSTFDVERKAFVPFFGGPFALYFEYSRDSRSALYVKYVDRTLWRVDADGGNPRQLTPSSIDVEGASWSPDGQWIAFRGGRRKGHMRVYLVHRDEGAPYPITTADVEQGIPSWGADPSLVAFGDLPEKYGDPTGSERIHIYNRRTRSMVDLPAAPEPVGTVRWSPDGRYLCAVTFADPRRLWLFDVRTREWRRQSATHVEYPTWTRDSRYIHYDTEGSAAGELRRFRVADGVDEKIVDVYEIPVERAWGWSGVAPDGSPLILRFPAPQLYQIDLFNRVAR